MDEKMNFANYLAENNGGLLAPNMTDCERYGMTWGCDEDCPVFQNGDCEFQEELEKEWERND